MFTFESFYSRKIDSVISLPEIFLSRVDREASTNQLRPDD